MVLIVFIYQDSFFPLLLLIKNYHYYDSAVKDPAVGLFDAYFGKEWSNTFVHDFLFSYSKAPDDPVASPHVHNFKIANNGEVNIKSN
jgi:hypothetical protein